MTAFGRDLQDAVQATFLRSAPLSLQAYEILRNAIVDLRLLPGAPLRKEELCDVWGISRTPISEALARLAEDGLVEIRPQHGTFVSRIRLDAVHEGAFVRRALESAATRRVATKMPNDVVSEIDRNLRFQAASVEAVDLPGFHRLDQEFHALICSLTGFPRVGRLVVSSRTQLDRVRFLILPTPGRLAETFQEHVAIFKVLKSRDPAAAGQAMEIHLDQTPKELDALIAERPEFFDEVSQRGRSVV